MSETLPHPRRSVVMTADLQAAIADAYDIFAPYRDRFTATVCTCPSCFVEADRERLLATPLREIDGFHLDPEHTEAALAVGAYLSSPQATARIEAAFFRTTDPDALTLMSDALFLAPAPP
jgi:hypothetical protein